MHVGFTSMNTLDDIAPAELGRLLEDAGYESLWTGEHPQIPVERRTPYPAGGELPAPYLEMMNPFLSLLVAAGATERLVVGTSVALPLEHDVFDLAKTVATLDRHTGGRFELGVGVGWNEEELANHRPIPWTARYRALEECVGALRALWTDEQAEFHGEFFDFDPVWSLPKPERPHGPPVVCGMSGRLGTAHAVRWADGWMPMDLALGDLEGAHGGVHASSLANKIDRFRAAAADAGRGELPISMVTWGDPTPDTLRAYRDLGVHRVLLGAGRKGWTDAASARPFIERYAAVLDELATS
ncbi:MAG TPA: TIGR03619 family F420-dependent LLM class oxidoreductase [Acidimicrobiales bacterium]|nr:TIGR03619 family F420-dependent LLM class oxidoreductase [Acidimicrobiales bacterium]